MRLLPKCAGMATLMEVFDSSGASLGRCDERCYDAHELVCVCVCQGRNHGVGLKNARKVTEERADKLISTYAARLKLSPGGYTATIFSEDANQGRLF